MASEVVTTFAPDIVMRFDINPGARRPFLESRAEKGPRPKCVEGKVTLVSPGKPHETQASRLDYQILAVCHELGIACAPLGSTTWTLPVGSEDTAYEADRSYHLGRVGIEVNDQPPDLAVEVVVSHSEWKALRAGAILGIPELWVLDLARHRLRFHHLATRGKARGTYRLASRSRAFPMLTSAETLQRLDDPEANAVAFHERCRAWARTVLAPRRGR